METTLTFRDYQKQAILTSRLQGESLQSIIVPLLGLAGEAGSLLSEYKKWMREGERYRPFTDQVAEEIGRHSVVPREHRRRGRLGPSGNR
jgi:hypothetical protein